MQTPHGRRESEGGKVGRERLELEKQEGSAAWWEKRKGRRTELQHGMPQLITPLDADS